SGATGGGGAASTAVNTRSTATGRAPRWRTAAALLSLGLLLAGCHSGAGHHGAGAPAGSVGPAGGNGAGAPGAAAGGGAGTPGQGGVPGAAGGTGGARGTGGAGGSGGSGASGPFVGSPTDPGAGPARPKGWRKLPAAPLRSRHGASAVWTGREMIVWGGAWRAGNASIWLDDGAAYDPAGDKWRRLANSPLEPRSD